MLSFFLISRVQACLYVILQNEMDVKLSFFFVVLDSPMQCIVCNVSLRRPQLTLCPSCTSASVNECLILFYNNMYVEFKKQPKLFPQKVTVSQWVSMIMYMLQRWPTWDDIGNREIPSNAAFLLQSLVDNIYTIGEMLTDKMRMEIFCTLTTSEYWQKMKKTPIMQSPLKQISDVFGNNASSEDLFLKFFVKRAFFVNEALEVYTKTLTATTTLLAPIQEIIYDYAPFCNCTCMRLKGHFPSLVSIKLGCDYVGCRSHLSCTCCQCKSEMLCAKKLSLGRCSQCAISCTLCSIEICHIACSKDCSVCKKEDLCDLCAHVCAAECQDNAVCKECLSEHKCETCKNAVCVDSSRVTCSVCLEVKAMCSECQTSCKTCNDAIICAACSINHNCQK